MKVGLIGYGYWGRKLAKEYKDLGIDLSICDLVAPNAVRNYEQMFKKVNSVHIATPNETHYRIATDALNAGMNILVEKPMTKKSIDAYDLVNLAEEKNLKLQVGHIFRFDNSVRTLKKYIRKGELGDVYNAKLTWTTNQVPLPPERDIIFDLGPHPVDILNYIFREYPTNVSARSESYVRKQTGLEEWAMLNLEYSSNKHATVELSWIDPREKKREIQINASKVCATVDTTNQTMKLYRGKDMINIPIERSNTIREEILNFMNGESNGEIGAKTVEILERMI